MASRATATAKLSALRQGRGFELKFVAVFTEHDHSAVAEFADLDRAGEGIEDLDAGGAGGFLGVAAGGFFVDLLGLGAIEVIGADADAPVFGRAEERLMEAVG